MQIPNLVFYEAFIYNTILACPSLFDILYKTSDNEKYVSNSNSYLMFHDNFYVHRDYEGSEMQIEIGEFAIKNDEKTGQLSYDENISRYLRTMGSYLYSVKLDIESFYPNIYTHSIAQLKNKEPFISIVNADTYFDFLDYYNMKVNSNQTKRIMAGVFSSTISAELLLLNVDYEICKIIEGKGIEYIRYVDDVTFFCDSQEKIHSIIPLVQNLLTKSRLRINNNKTESKHNVDNINSIDLLTLNNLFTETDISFDRNVFINVKTIISEYLSKNKYSEIKALLTKLKKLSINEKIIFDSKNDNDITIYFCNYLLQLLFRNPIFISRAYSLIEQIVTSVKDKDPNCLESIINCIESKSNLINSEYSNTVLQIWHYYFLNRFNPKDSDRYFVNLKQSSEEINTIVLTSFIKEGNKENKEIFKYIVEKYSKAIKSSKSNEWKKSLMLSKWWLPIFKISLVDSHNYYSFMDAKSYPKSLRDLIKEE